MIILTFKMAIKCIRNNQNHRNLLTWFQNLTSTLTNWKMKILFNQKVIELIRNSRMILSKLHLYLKINQFSKKMNSWKNQTIKNSMIWTIIKAWNIIFLIWRIKNDCWKVKNYSIHNTNAELLEPIFHQSTLFLDAKCLLAMLVRNLQIIIEKNVCI